MSKSDFDGVEVLELSQEEWDAATTRQLNKIGLTAQQLKQKHDEDNLDHKEFKVWMLLGSSSLLD